MRAKIYTLFIGLLTCSALFSQGKGPYTINHSAEFENPNNLLLTGTSSYSNGNTLLTFVTDGSQYEVICPHLDKVTLELFSPELKQIKMTSPDLKSLFPDQKSYFGRVAVMNKKSYLCVKQVFKETKTEGMSAVEFSPTDLTLIGTPIKLYESTRGVINGLHHSTLSQDKTKFFYKSDLIDKERKNPNIPHEYGFYMFDENMKKIWGGEYEIPVKASPIDYLVSNDGKLYYLMKISSETGNSLELFVYDKDKKDPKVIDIPLENYDYRIPQLTADNSGNIIIVGFYSKKDNPFIDGAYVLKQDPTTGKFTNFGTGHYKIPFEVIKSHTSDRTKRKLEKKEEKEKDGDESKDLGVFDLTIRNLSFMDNGSLAIISEVHASATITQGASSHSDVAFDEIFIFNIDATGKLAYIKKIPKRQRGTEGSDDLSISATVKGNHIHIFYADNPENFNLNENEPAKSYDNRTNGIITCIDMDEKGEIKKYNLGEMNQFETRLHIRDLKNGGNNNLIALEKRKNGNTLYSMDIK